MSESDQPATPAALAPPQEPPPAPLIPFKEMTEQEYEAYVSQWIGIPYVLNGEDPTVGLDCRTLAIQFLRGQGINIKNTDDQPLPDAIDEATIARYEQAVKEAGVTVELKDLKRNDLVWYYNKLHQLHVGVWLGYDRILTTGLPYKSIIYKLKREKLAGAVRGTHGIWLDTRGVEAPPGHPPVLIALEFIGFAVTLGAVAGTGALIIGAIVVGAAVATAVHFGLGAMAAGRKSFDFNGSAGAGLDASQRYAFDGAKNIRSNQAPVPLIYSGLGIRMLQTYEIWNSGQGAQTQKRLVVIGEGELGSITEVKLNGTDIATFTGTSFTAYTGTATQGVDARAAGTNVVGLKNTAYLALTLAASDKLSGDPIITCKVTGRKINIWNGTNWTTLAVAASGNPAAAIRDYMTLTRERGGCGFPTSMIDDASFGAVYDWAEVTVTNLDSTTEPRARLDMIIDASRPWLDNLQDMLSTFGGFIVSDGRKFFLRVEKSESPIQSFTDDQIWDVEYQTFQKDDRPNRITGVYIDPTAAGHDARTRVSVDDLTDQASNPRGIVPREVNLLGLSRQTQCIREITKIANDLKVNWYSLTLTTDVNALAVEAGDVISVTHPILGDGATAYQFRVTRILENEDHTRKLICKAYNSSIFGDTMEQQSVTLNYTAPLNPFTAIADVTGLTIVEATTIQGDGTAFITVNASWTAPPETLYLKYYEVAVKKSTDGAYTVLGFTKDVTFTVVWNFVVGGSYTVRVRTVNVNEVYSAGAISAALVISGTPAVPANVANFAATFLKEIVFSWDKNTEANLAGYEIRDENANFGVQSAHLIWRGLANKFTIVTPASRSPGTYYIKAYNRSGGFSATAQSVTPTNPAPAIPTIALTVWFGFAKLQWTDVTDADLLNYEVWKSATNAWTGEEVLESKVPGTEVIVQGNDPVDATSTAITSTTMTDAGIAGKGTNYFVGDRIKQTSGTFTGQEATVTAYDTATGVITVASWPSGTPTVGDQFVLKDRAYFKVRGVDTYGPGSFSSAQTIDFTPLAASELGDQVISARKLIAGQVITLSAQIKDAIITNAKILDLDGGKITAATITAAKLNVSQLSAITADLGAITAGTIVLPSGGNVRSGQTAYNTGVGFFLGNVGGTPQFSIGNPSGNRMTWDGTTLTIRGTLNADDITVGTLTADRIINGGTGFGGKQVFTSSGTFTGPTGVTKVWVRCWGGGAGGAGSNPGGGNETGNPGGAGGDTTFNSTTVVAKGGSANTTNIGGNGGTGGTGDLTIAGQDGGAPATAKGGDGGTAGAGGGKGGRGNNGSGPNGAQPGGGGAGASDHNSAAAPGGGGGEYAEAVVSSTPSTNYTVTIGAGGTAGGAGSGGNAGGTGGAGLCIVSY